MVNARDRMCPGGVFSHWDHCRAVTWVCLAQNLDILHSIRFLSEQLGVDDTGTLRLLENHPEVLLRGTALSFDALLAVLPIQKAELEVCTSLPSTAA